MKYKAKSAEVLNEADRFEQVMNWMLFTSKQEMMLWGDSEKLSWRPGDPLYMDPREIPPYQYSDLEFYRWDGYWGNHVRPMIEEFDDGYPFVYKMRCEPCGVSWFEGDICWMCGGEYPRPDLTFRHIQSITGRSVGVSAQAQLSMDMQGAIRVYLEDEWQAMWAEHTMAFAREMRMSTARIGRRFAEAGQAMRGLTGVMQHFSDEFRLIPMRHSLQPVYIHGVEIPANWMELTPDIPLPEMPEPPDYSNLVIRSTGPRRNNGRRNLVERG